MSKKVLSPGQIIELRKYISNPEKYMHLLDLMNAFPVLWYTEKGYTTNEDEAVYNSPLYFQIIKGNEWWQAVYTDIRDGGDIEKISRKHKEVIDSVFDIFLWICKNKIIS